MNRKDSPLVYLSRKCQRGIALLSALIFIIIGILFWGGFNWSLELTNTEEFCISCHEMRDNVYQEYRSSAHFSNSTGVRATCPDCHVPREWVHKVVRKIQASNELIHHFLGSLDSREKFTNKRLELASHVWETMQATDSRECRNCHSEAAMDTNKQRDIAVKQHTLAKKQNKTCIDCHKGIAHKLPESFLESEHERFEVEKVACYSCHREMARPAKDDNWE